jgi:ASC-1-like (ASCH) protein
MDHVAIMKKSWRLIPKILDGRKKIESRWSKNKCTPWGKVKTGDVVYFKNAGEEVIARARVSDIKEFSNLTPKKVRELLEKYGGDDGISATNLEETIKWAKDKRYCTLIYLVSPKEVRSFNIDKRGFGMAAAWITTKSIEDIRI